MKNKISNKFLGFAQQSIPATLLALLVASCGGDEKDYCIYNQGADIVDKGKRISLNCADHAIRGVDLNSGRQWARCELVCEGNNKLIVERMSCEGPSVYNLISDSCVLPEGACQYLNGETMTRPYEEMDCSDSRVFDALRETIELSRLNYGRGICSATCLDNGEIRYEYHGYNRDGNIAMLQSVIKNKMQMR